MTKTGFDLRRRYALGVIIVNYRTAALVERCLEALAPSLETCDGAVVIVDNDSGDGSLERLTDYCAASLTAERMKVVASPKNGGFSFGNNVGLKSVNAENILFLNSDAIPSDRAIEAMMAAAAKSQDADIFTPQICWSSGSPQVSRFRRHSIVSEFIDGAQTGPLTQLMPFGEVPIFPEDIASDPDWVSFSAVMIRKPAIDQAGPMDEGFFLYYEDCDYCLRLKKNGARTVFVPDAVFTHDPGGTTGLREKEEGRERLPEYYYRSRTRFFRKVYGPLGPALANIAWLAGRMVARLRGLIGRPAPGVAKGRARDIWIG